MIQTDELSLDFFDNALLDENIPFRDEWKKAGVEHEEALWANLHDYLLLTQRAYYKFDPTYSYIPGEGADRYNFGTYLHMINVRAKKSRQKEFENFVRQIMVTTASEIMPKRKLEQVASTDRSVPLGDFYRLSRYFRATNLTIKSAKQIELQKFIREKLLAAAKKLNVSVHYYRVGFGKDEFAMVLFPFEDLGELQGIKDDSVYAALFTKAFPEEGEKLLKQFYSYLWRTEETVMQVRPDLSTLLENRFEQTWWADE